MVLHVFLGARFTLALSKSCVKSRRTTTTNAHCSLFVAQSWCSVRTDRFPLTKTYSVRCTEPTRVFSCLETSHHQAMTAPPSQPCPAPQESVPRLLLPQPGHLGTLCLCHVSRAHPHCLRLSESLGCQVHHKGCPSGKTCSDCPKVQLTNLFLMQKLMFF